MCYCSLCSNPMFWSINASNFECNYEAISAGPDKHRASLLTRKSDNRLKDLQNKKLKYFCVLNSKYSNILTIFHLPVLFPGSLSQPSNTTKQTKRNSPQNGTFIFDILHLITLQLDGMEPWFPLPIMAILSGSEYKKPCPMTRDFQCPKIGGTWCTGALKAPCLRTYLDRVLFWQLPCGYFSQSRKTSDHFANEWNNKTVY